MTDSASIPKKKPQKQRILEWLQSGRTLTPLEAWREFGCYRLSARILELREAGHKIRSEDSECGQFAIYRMEAS